jgi:AmmeMemoRadiSam system protein B
LITAAKTLGAKKAELLCYKTSGDITGDYSAVVGYASIAITRSQLV